MKVIIAGYNIDKSLIDTFSNDVATPEVISAAYARISRSAKDVNELRKIAIHEVDKSRKSNSKIIFDMGHSSVAEHAVFNIDLIGVSRLLTETIQRSRIASFTEKSQRYVTFSKDYLIPPEILNINELKTRYIELMDDLFREYETSCQALTAHYEQFYPTISSRLREGMAKEDARYILPLATKTQMGMTINARSLENLLRRLAKSAIAEAHELKHQIQSQISIIAPSLIRYTETDGFIGAFGTDSIESQSIHSQFRPYVDENVTLISSSHNPDDKILTAMLYSENAGSWYACQEQVNNLSTSNKELLWNQIFKGLRNWHKLPRAFETAEYEFELVMSECCWAQFKRHRFCTLLKSELLGTDIFIPESINKVNRSTAWESLSAKCAEFTNILPNSLQHISNYVRLNSSICSVYSKMNLREIYHFVRLRSDEHAQWEIRCLSDRVSSIVQQSAPNAAKHLCGKSNFKQIC